MAAVRFYTRATGNKPVPVYINFRDKEDFWIRIVTDYSILPRYWSNRKQALKPNLDFPSNADQIAVETKVKEWNELSTFILNEHKKLTVIPSKQWLKDTIDKFKNRVAPSTETLNEYIKRFIDEAASGKRLASAGNTKKRYSYGSLRVLRGFMLSFNMFQGIENEEIKSRGKQYPKQPYKPLNWNDISIDTYNDFVQFFYSRNCGANYIGKHIKSFKTIFRAAREENPPLHNNMEIERRAFKTISEEVDHIYLTEAELKKLFDLDLSGNKIQQVVRDVFLAGCYVAQRYSDYSRINKSNIKEIAGTKYIELVQKKTGTKCVIPVKPELDTILQRYDYTLPKTFEQKVNAGIKKIAEKAQIIELIHVEKNRGGLNVKSDVRKCDLIKTHTARRTGISLMYLAKDENGNRMPITDIMKLSGHKTEKEFRKYLRVSNEETAVSLASHPYFRGNVLKVVK
jgi:hypothetical protein